MKNFVKIVISLCILLVALLMPVTSIFATGGTVEEKPYPPTITKEAYPTHNVRAGDRITYTITVHNPHAEYDYHEHKVVDRFPVQHIAPDLSTLRVYQNGVRLTEGMAATDGYLLFPERLADDDELALLIWKMPPGSYTVITFEAVVQPGVTCSTTIVNNA